MFSSCAIHNKFPFICFFPGCIKSQFDTKQLRKKMKIAMGGKMRKFKMSVASSKNNNKNYSYSKKYNSKNSTTRDSVLSDTVIKRDAFGGSFALLDTIIRIYYKDLTDSVLNKHKAFIKAFIVRTGINHISEVSFTDFYSNEDGINKSIKPNMSSYLMSIGLSKHRLFWRKNKHIKLPDILSKPGCLIYLEIRFN